MKRLISVIFLTAISTAAIADEAVPQAPQDVSGDIKCDFTLQIQNSNLQVIMKKHENFHLTRSNDDYYDIKWQFYNAWNKPDHAQMHVPVRQTNGMWEFVVSNSRIQFDPVNNIVSYYYQDNDGQWFNVLSDTKTEADTTYSFNGQCSYSAANTLSQ